MTPSRDTTLRTPDGRDLEVFVDGPDDGLLFVFQSGTPSAADRYPPLIDAASARGLRTVNYSRPGYSGSTGRPERTVADAAADVQTIVTTLSADRFVTLGWSGGGPHALACAALLPEMCLAASTLAGVAPYAVEGLDWFAGMGEENVQEFRAAVEGAAPLTALLEEWAPELRSITADNLAAAMGDIISEVDQAASTGELSAYLASSMRRALSTGVSGWRDDDLAFVAPWGFDVAATAVPVSVWQGREDRMVPFDHGRWLVEHVTGANPHLYDDEGHLSLVAKIERILDDLLVHAGPG